MRCDSQLPQFAASWVCVEMSGKDYGQHDEHSPKAAWRHGRMSRRQRSRALKKEGKRTVDETFRRQWELFGIIPKEDDDGPTGTDS